MSSIIDFCLLRSLAASITLRGPLVNWSLELVPENGNNSIDGYR